MAENIQINWDESNDNPFSFEKSLKGLVCGLDEAGRAPLAGPVTAACVAIPIDVYDHPVWTWVTDSKKLSEKKREQAFSIILDTCYYGIGWVTARDIEQMNIHHASLLAMRKAYEKMCHTCSVHPDKAFVDGKHCPSLSCDTQAVVKGDLRCKSIAAASILAKVSRDSYMKDLDGEYPAYGWSQNKGYPVKKHVEALKTCGPTKYHRRTFSGVSEYFDENNSSCIQKNSKKYRLKWANSR